MLKNILSPDFINAILRASTPILFATLASAVASKSGITNMALEGMLLFSALFGVIFSSLTHSFLGGLLITMVIGGLIGFFLAFFILQLKTDEILAAIALNLIATGGTVLLMLAVFRRPRCFHLDLQRFGTDGLYSDGCADPVPRKSPFRAESDDVALPDRRCSGTYFPLQDTDGSEDPCGRRK